MTKLAPYAVSDSESRGREYPEKSNMEFCVAKHLLVETSLPRSLDDRTAFQKDRDRIIHCRSFRRLNLKTQVFVANHGDHYRTRLTHTLEVAQIARDIARSLCLNEDLAEAIALAHDLGHTPFGHAGEMAMDRCMQKFGLSFEHNEQSRRVVTVLESAYPDFPGLNLSFEVLDGLAKHQTPWDNPSGGSDFSPSLEAQVVNIADEIAYSNHDIDDGLRSGILDWNELVELPIVQEALANVLEEYGEIEDLKILQARVVSGLIGLMIKELIKNTSSRISGFKSIDEVYSQKDPLVVFEIDFEKKMRELKEFLQSKFYFNEGVLKFSRKGEEIIEVLFDHYMKENEDVVSVKDYICGMTDVYARDMYAKIAS